MQMTLNDRCRTMPWDAIDDVVFDVGNVLLTFQPAALLRALLPGHEDAYPLLRASVFESPYWCMFDRGMINTEEAIALMSRRCPSLRPEIDHIMRHWNVHLEVIDEGVRALRTCKGHGKRCLVLSNYSSDPFDDSCRRHPDIFSLFDGFAVSARLHLTKPDPRIYHRLINEFHLTSERTLFIDDSAVNIENAMACGLQALHYHQPGTLDAFIR